MVGRLVSSSRSGDATSARAMATRFFQPAGERGELWWRRPEKAASALRPRAIPVQPSSASISCCRSASARIAAGGTLLLVALAQRAHCARPSATASNTLASGEHRLLRRWPRAARFAAPSPSSSACAPASTFNSELLPAPLRPIRPMRSRIRRRNPHHRRARRDKGEMGVLQSEKSHPQSVVGARSAFAFAMASAQGLSG